MEQGTGDTAAAATSAMPQTAGESLGMPTGSQAVQPTSQLMQLIQAISQGGAMGGGSMTTMQPSLTTPKMPVQYQAPGAPQVAQGPFGSSGERKRADRQATLNNLAQLTHSVTDYMHQKKVQEYSTTIEKVMNAQAGMQEAQNALQTAQQNKDIAGTNKAEEDLKHNKEVLATIFEDPKASKILEKAFSVKLLGDDKGKASPEYQALNLALKNKDAQAKKDAALAMADKFMKTQPTRQQISPQYQALAQLIKDKIIPEANERAKQQTEFVKVLSEAEQKGFDRESKEKIAQIVAGVKDRETEMKYFQAVNQQLGRQGVAEIMARASNYRARTMADAMIQSSQWRMAGSILARKEGAKGQSQLFNNLSKEHQRISDKIKDDQKQLQALGTADSIKDWMGQSKKANAIKQDLDDLRQQQELLLNRMNRLSMGEPLASGTPEPGAAASGQDSGFADFDRFFESQLDEDSGSN
jgi:hypothetical protein